MDFAQDEAVALQAAERLREHLLRDSADCSPQLSVALGSIRQDLDNERCPLIGDPIQHHP